MRTRARVTRTTAIRPAVVPAAAALLLICVGSPSARPGMHREDPHATAASSAHALIDQVPLAFRRNIGQAPRTVRYLGQAPGVGALFEQTSVTLVLTRPSTGSPVTKSTSTKTTSITLRLEQANHHARITAASPAPETVNDFHTSDAARWHTAIRAYREVIYHQVWPGIDAVFTAHSGVLKYSFQVAPGADPSRIQLAYLGARRVSLDPNGELAVNAGGIALHDQAPVSYQGSGTHRRPVTARYQLLGGTRFALTTGRYDRTRPLTVDPGLEYSSYFGGNGNDLAFKVVTDRAGDVYIAGISASTDLPTTAHAYQRQLGGGASAFARDDPDLFVAKLNPSGTPVFSTYVGGSRSEGGWGLAVDAAGNTYLAGSSASADFPVTAHAFQRSMSPAGQSGVVVKLDPTGSKLLFSTYLAPGLVNTDVTVGADGSVTVVGDTGADYAPTTPGAFQPRDLGGNPVGYVARLNATGSQLEFGTYVGVPGYGLGLLSSTVDSAGAIYLAGSAAAGFPTTPGAYQPAAPHGGGIVIKLDPTGAKLDYATYYGNNDPTSGSGVVITAIAVDGTGSLHLAASLEPGLAPTTPGAFATNCKPDASFCTAVAQLDSTGSKLESSTYFGGSSATEPDYSLAADTAGRTYVVGRTPDADMPTTSDALYPTKGDYTTAFFLAVFHNGALLYSTYFGGTGTVDFGWIAFDAGNICVAPEPANGTVYLAGATSATTFPVTAGAFQSTNHGGLYGEDAWSAKITIPALTASANARSARTAR